jgi:hypothetical protein
LQVLVIDAQVVKTATLVAVAGPKDDDLHPHLGADVTTAALPGLLLKGAMNAGSGFG